MASGDNTLAQQQVQQQHLMWTPQRQRQFEIASELYHVGLYQSAILALSIQLCGAKDQELDFKRQASGLFGQCLSRNDEHRRAGRYLIQTTEDSMGNRKPYGLVPAINTTFIEPTIAASAFPLSPTLSTISTNATNTVAAAVPPSSGGRKGTRSGKSTTSGFDQLLAKTSTSTSLPNTDINTNNSAQSSPSIPMSSSPSSSSTATTPSKRQQPPPPSNSNAGGTAIPIPIPWPLKMSPSEHQALMGAKWQAYTNMLLSIVECGRLVSREIINTIPDNERTVEINRLLIRLSNIRGSNISKADCWRSILTIHPYAMEAYIELVKLINQEQTAIPLTKSGTEGTGSLKHKQSSSFGTLDDVLAMIPKDDRKEIEWMSTYLKGIDLLCKLQYEEAYTTFKKLDNLYPGNADVKLRMAFCLRWMNKLARSCFIYNQVLRIDPHITLDMWIYATVLKSLGKFSNLNRLCLSLLHINPKSPETWVSQAILWDAKGDHVRAQTMISKALKLDPNHYGALQTKALQVRESSDPQLALSYFREAMAIQRDPVVFEGLVDAYLAMDRVVEAFQVAREAKALMPKIAQVVAIYGLAIHRLSQSSAVTIALLDGDGIGGGGAIGRAGGMVDQWDAQQRAQREAKEHFHEALKLDRGCWTAAKGLSRLYEGLDQDALAIETLERQLEYQSATDEVHVMKAEYFARREKWSSAFSSFQMALAVNPLNEKAKLGLEEAEKIISGQEEEELEEELDERAHHGLEDFGEDGLAEMEDDLRYESHGHHDNDDLDVNEHERRMIMRDEDQIETGDELEDDYRRQQTPIRPHQSRLYAPQVQDILAGEYATTAPHTPGNPFLTTPARAAAAAAVAAGRSFDPVEIPGQREREDEGHDDNDLDSLAADNFHRRYHFRQQQSQRRADSSPPPSEGLYISGLEADDDLNQLYEHSEGDFFNVDSEPVSTSLDTISTPHVGEETSRGDFKGIISTRQEYGISALMQTPARRPGASGRGGGIAAVSAAGATLDSLVSSQSMPVIPGAPAARHQGHHHRQRVSPSPSSRFHQQQQQQRQQQVSLMNSSSLEQGGGGQVIRAGMARGSSIPRSPTLPYSRPGGALQQQHQHRQPQHRQQHPHHQPGGRQLQPQHNRQLQMHPQTMSSNDGPVLDDDGEQDLEVDLDADIEDHGAL